MEQNFITVHNLAENGIILSATWSIYEILGYTPEEVSGRSCFDYFHPDDIALSRSIYNREILLNAVANLHSIRIRSRHGRYIHCECYITVVEDVLVAYSRIQSGGEKSERCAIEAVQISHIFSFSPMVLERFSPPEVQPVKREARGALMLNRFTRSLTITFATDTAAQILGIRPSHLKNKSFYELIQESCLADVTRCTENAKSYNSITYLSFGLKMAQKDGNEDSITDRCLPNANIKVYSERPCYYRLRKCTGPLDLEAIIFPGSDGLLVVLQRNITIGNF